VTRWLLALAVLAVAPAARAEVQAQCHTVTATFVPSDQLQIVGWIEKADKTYVDTIYMTQKTGHYGLGNRPGRFDFNSGPTGNDMWPYGRRVSTFPVWAHRHGKSFPLIVFQDGFDSDLSHAVDQSTLEHTPYCQPMNMNDGDPAKRADWDAGTCATGNAHTDKGVFDPKGGTSLYPPRADVTPSCSDQGCDSPSVPMYRAINVFDSVSQATPVGGTSSQMAWQIPPDLPQGDYVLWIEVGREYDFNATYHFASPANISYGEYGVAYRGQPSIVYSVPFTIAATDTTASTQNYVGYGDAAGSSGVLHAPDSTITNDTPGSGAQRLQLIPGSSDRVQVLAKIEHDVIPPANLTGVATTAIAQTSVTVEFVAPGDDGTLGMVSGYDVRYRTDGPVTADNFDDARTSKVLATFTPAASGALQTVELDGLLPDTDYWVGIRAYDDCRNTSDIADLQVTTAKQVGGYVDACFIATAAYGSRMAGDIEPLRRFRDFYLKTSVLGELAVETYYTFGPAVAGPVGESELLRETARALLAPIVARVRQLGL
jgi:hypothetical protein